MIEKPEFEPEFYAKQIEQMANRYSKLFSKWNLSWKKYYDYVCYKLRDNQYWIWIFLCGFEKFIKEKSEESKGRRNRLYKDADMRIYRIIGNTYQIENYIRSL